MIGCIILWEQIEGLAAIISSIARSAGVGTVVDVGAGQVHLYPGLRPKFAAFELTSTSYSSSFLS